MDRPGVTRGKKLDKVGNRSHGTAELFFENVRVPVSNLLGAEENQGFSQLKSNLVEERLIIAIQSIALVERALALTLEYVKERKAFGKRIIEFQNTEFKLVECITEATVGKSFVNACIQQYLEGKLDATTAAMAKYWITELQGRVIDICVQFHGGYGFMNEYEIARMYRNARVSRIFGGTNEIMKVIIGRSL
jgi:acyl-CoA dehydrogenase